MPPAVTSGSQQGFASVQMIRVSELTKRFGPTTAVDRISFEIGRGEVVGFLGPNGAGKTTTIRVLTGFHPATSGSAEVAGFDVQKQSLEVRRSIGYLPQEVPIYPDLRVGEYLRYRAELKVLGTWPQAASMATVSPALEAALKANAAQAATSGASASGASSLTLTAALLGALLGGLILNLMPCVFPVLAIKVVGFTRHADDRQAHRVSGLAYTAGVVASFMALGALVLALRTAGAQLGWGFQLQSPAFVAALAALFTAIGLNLAGLFEFGAVLPSIDPAPVNLHQAA